MSRMDRSRRKKRCRLWTWIFSFGLLVCCTQIDWTASIIIIVKGNVVVVAGYTQTHSSAHRPLSSQSLIRWRQMQWWHGGDKASGRVAQTSCASWSAWASPSWCCTSPLFSYYTLGWRQPLLLPPPTSSNRHLDSFDIYSSHQMLA